MNRKIMALCLGLFSCIAQAGVILEVSTVDFPGKKVIVLHDYHDNHDADNNTLVLEDGVEYPITKAAIKQKAAFAQWIKESFSQAHKSQALLLVECRPGLPNLHYQIFHYELGQNKYDVQYAKNCMNDEDFFWHHYVWPHMHPTKHPIAPEYDVFDKVINCDSRGFDSDCMFKPFTMVEDMFGLDAQSMKELKKEHAKQPWYDKMKKIGKQWLTTMRKQIMDYYTVAEKHLCPEARAAVIQEINERYDKVVQLFTKHLGTTSCSSLYESLCKFAERNDKAVFDEVQIAYLLLDALIVDLEIIQHIYSQSYPVVMVYCGASHAQHVVSLLEGNSGAVSSKELCTSSLINSPKRTTKALSRLVGEKGIYPTMSLQETQDSWWNYIWNVVTDWNPFASQQTTSTCTKTPFLHLALHYGHDDTAKYLVEHADADLNAVNHAGYTPLQLANNNKNKTMTAYLSGKQEPTQVA